VAAVKDKKQVGVSRIFDQVVRMVPDDVVEILLI